MELTIEETVLILTVNNSKVTNFMYLKLEEVCVGWKMKIKWKKLFRFLCLVPSGAKRRGFIGRDRKWRAWREVPDGTEKEQGQFPFKWSYRCEKIMQTKISIF